MIVDKPWGKITTYALNQPTSVRMVTIEPGASSNEHYHRLRDEMWLVLDPGLVIQVGNRRVEAAVGEEFMVAAEEPHRIINQGAETGRVLEISFGYTTEDDAFPVRGADGESTVVDVSDGA